MYNPICRLTSTGSTQHVNYIDADQNSKTAFSSQMPTPYSCLQMENDDNERFLGLNKKILPAPAHPSQYLDANC